MKIVHWTEGCPMYRPTRPLYSPHAFPDDQYGSGWRLCQRCCPDLLPDTWAVRGVDKLLYADTQRRFCVPCMVLKRIERGACRRMYCYQSGEVELMCERCVGRYAVEEAYRAEAWNSTNPGSYSP